MTATSKVADIGSGTGIFSKLLCEVACEVYAVEPNQEMRAAAESLLKDLSNFHSVKGQAENTSLPEKSIDLITAAQAFHWFDPGKSKAEFRRILKPKGRVAIIWNDRETDSDFGLAYEAFLNVHTIDYPQVRDYGEQAEKHICSFFGEGKWVSKKFPNHQDLSWDSLWGRFLSTSYSPKPEHPQFVPAERALRKLFEMHQSNETIRLVYNTEVYLGHV